MLQVVMDQDRLRRPLPPVPFGALFPSEWAQPSQVLAASANLEELKSESLMFDAA
jgi:hypothetical protein